MENNIRNLLKKINSLITIEQVLEQILDKPDSIEEKEDKIRSYCPIHGERLLRTLTIDMMEKSFKCSYTFCAGYRGGDLFTLYCLSTKTTVRDAIKFWAQKLKLDDLTNSNIEELDLENLNPALLQKSSRTYFMPQHTSAKLTGAIIKDSILVTIQKELDRAYRYNRDLGFILLYMDLVEKNSSIKTQVIINRIQQNVNDILNKSLRTVDVWGYYGTDRYVILLPETNQNNTLTVSKKLKIELLKYLKTQKDYFPYHEDELADKIHFGMTGISAKKHKKILTADDLIVKAESELAKSRQGTPEIIEK